MAAGFLGVAVRQLREAARLMRLAPGCVASRARAWRLASDAHILGRAIGAASVVLAADAAMRRAEGWPVVLPVAPVGRRARLSRVEVAERAAVVAWFVVLVVAVVTK